MEIGPDILKVIVTNLIAWGAWVTRSIYKNKQDIDTAFYQLRGGKGMRDRSIRGRLKRLTYRGKKHA